MQNPATYHPARLAAWAQLRRDVPSFTEARARVASADASGHRLHWMSANASGSCDLPASRDAFLVIGRHSRCDVVLGADPCVALRHVIVRSSVLDDGCPIVSVLDLRTRDGFEIADGTVQRSVIATGPLAVRVGAYVLVALPGGASLEGALHPPACERAEVHPYRAAARRVDGEPAPSSRAVSRVTLMSCAAVVSQRPRAGGSHEAARHELTLSAHGRSASVRLSGADLDRGVLVGRDPRCIDSGLRAILDGGISRVHLLLRRDARGAITAFDVASTQGTFQGGKRVRSVELADAGETLTIGSVSPIRVDWRAVQ
ncbi:MAG TPA: FHA domain-containing protein [Polyangiaceae bacterium]|nr:FHA domain-containing protein [Polyangiaceae bacterium]